MINEIQNAAIDYNYKHETIPGESDFIIHFHENQLALRKQNEEFSFPEYRGMQHKEKSGFIYLFSLNGHSCFLYRGEGNVVFEDAEYTELAFFRSCKQEEIAWLALLANQLNNWYISNKFCGKCGSKMDHKTDERAILCPNCQNLVFPSIIPAVIVAIIHEDHLLLARNSKFPNGRFSLIAGYVDLGESPEETVVREAREELGIDVFNVHYYGSQPWPLSSSLMLGFIAEADPDQPITVDGEEITEAAWFKRGQLPGHFSNLSISGELIDRFEKGLLK